MPCCSNLHWRCMMESRNARACTGSGRANRCERLVNNWRLKCIGLTFTAIGVLPQPEPKADEMERFSMDHMTAKSSHLTPMA